MLMVDHSRGGWIGVDLDGTLVKYDHWRGNDHIGDPIPLMVERVRTWIAEGRYVKIFTARVYGISEREMASIVGPIVKWLHAVGLPTLDITCVKDFNMIELWDDRAIQVITNTGRTIADELASECAACGEAGELANMINKRWRDGADLTEEIRDAS